MAKKYYELREVICPYYRHNTSVVLTCESAITKLTCNHVFATSAERHEHMKRLCETYDYHECPHAELIERTKYGAEK